MKTVWIGMIPGIFGYGLSAVGDTKKECMDALKKGYDEFKKGYPDPTTNFKKSYEYWGGYCKKVEMGKAYYDDFAE